MARPHYRPLALEDALATSLLASCFPDGRQGKEEALSQLAGTSPHLVVCRDLHVIVAVCSWPFLSVILVSHCLEGETGVVLHMFLSLYSRREWAGWSTTSQNLGEVN